MTQSRLAGWPRTAFLPGYLGPKGGGATRSSCLTAASLASRGLHVFVEGLYDQANPPRVGELPLASCDVRAHRVEHGPQGPVSSDLLRRMGAIMGSLDVVHLNGHWDAVNHQVADVCVAAAVPYIVSARATADFSVVDSLSPEIRDMLAADEARYVANAFAVHLTSRIEAKRARFEAPPRQVITIANPVELDHLSVLPDPVSTRAHLLVPGEHFAMLYYGRLIAQKQPGFTIEVLARMPIERNAHLYLVGHSTPETVASLRRLAQRLRVTDRVHFAGPAAGADRGRWLAAADVLLLPSISENFSLGLIESIAAGLPVVASPDVGAIEYLLDRDVVTTELDPAAWARICAAMPRRPARDEQTFTRLWNSFRPAWIVQEWLTLYQQMPRVPPTVGSEPVRPILHLTQAWQNAGALAPVQEQPIGGGASDRSVTRLHDTRGMSAITMIDSPIQGDYVSVPFDSTGPMDWVRAADVLQAAGLPVPRILHHEPQERWLLVEDFGDTSLRDLIDRTPAEQRAACYRQALQLLVQLQSATSNLQRDSLPLTRPLDQATLRWELFHYVEWGLEARSGRQIADDDRVVLLRQFDLLAGVLAGWRELTHRDFHAGNIMVRPQGGLGLIDFDDLCVGNPAYDLATLLIDGYSEVDLDLVDEMVRVYHELRAASPLPPIGLDEFWALFELQAVHRCFKAAGRFAWLDLATGRSDYAERVGLLLRPAAALLRRPPQLATIRDVLRRYEPSLDA